MLPGICGSIGGLVAEQAVAAAPLSFTGGLTRSDGVGTLASISLGAVHANRKLIVCVGYGDDQASTNTSISTVTVGGYSATRQHRYSTANTYRNVEFWTIDAGAGSGLENATSADVVITLANGGTNIERYSCGIYRVIGLVSETPSAMTTGTGTTGSIAIPSKGFAILYVSSNPTGNSWSITGVDSIDYNSDPFGVSGSFMLGSKSSVAGETATGLGPSGSPVLPRYAAASWQLA